MATKPSGGTPRSKPAYPSGSKRPQRFDDNALVRTVLAKPLLDLITQDREAETDLRTRLGSDLPPDSTAVRLNPDFQGGVRAAATTVRDFIAEYHRNLRIESASGKRLVAKRGKGVLIGQLSQRMMDALVDANDELGQPVLYVWPRSWNVIIDISLKFETKGPQVRPPAASSATADRPFSIDPRIKADRAIREYIRTAIGESPNRILVEGIDEQKTQLSNQYVFARLGRRALFEAVRMDRESAIKIAQQELMLKAGDESQRRRGEVPDAVDDKRYRAIHQVWPDFQLRSCVYRSSRTVKADAAQNTFGAFGDGITWAVVDSGIDERHPHFTGDGNIDPASAYHADFSGENAPLIDNYGHGTHVAGIIAGRQCAETALIAAPSPPYTQAGRLRAASTERRPLDEFDNEFKVEPKFENVQLVGGLAPMCKLISLKVLDSAGLGMASNVIAAIAHIQQINGHGRDLKIHGVNISLGHEFDPLWFACGHSPLCVEVNRLVKSGVVVVVAAGNTGYGTVVSDERTRKSGLQMSINDPGNADLAITVGATHRDSPYRYGVSFFSSKGPTGDGRHKPDLVAPGERIVSAAVPGSQRFSAHGTDFAYAELSGTSMAAPHVSGAIAAFLSIRREFIGQSEKVKTIFTSTATDLGRERYFQGAGMVDLLRAIQSI